METSAVALQCTRCGKDMGNVYFAIGMDVYCDKCHLAKFPDLNGDTVPYERVIRIGGDSTLRPKIVCLCGSTRFSKEYQEANLRETLAGNIVLTIGCDMKGDAHLFADKSEAELQKIKSDLDMLHREKIFLADEVLILNVDGYIGDSTEREIRYAKDVGKPIRFLETKKFPMFKLSCPDNPDFGYMICRNEGDIYRAIGDELEDQLDPRDEGISWTFQIDVIMMSQPELYAMPDFER